jgi:hypothetical protein
MTPAASTTETSLLEMAEAIRGLQDQLQSLLSEVSDLKEQQEHSDAEMVELRRQLYAARSELALRSSGPLAAPAAPAQTSAPQLAAAETVSRLQDDLQLTEAKVTDQYQTKVESGSKYRVRLSGLLLLNIFENRGLAENMDFPTFSVPADRLDSRGSFGGSLRQSQIGLEVFGPEIAGARTNASVKLDFAGGFPDRADGVAQGLVRLRTATFRMDWKNTSLVGGQDALFFLPLSPTSLASVAVPPLSYAGNLWGWVPQVRVEHRVTLSENNSIQFQAGILDSFSGDYPNYSGTGRYPSWGEMSAQPAYASRISWSHPALGQTLTVGAGGFYGRQFWSLGRYVDGWAATLDVTAPLSKWLELTAAFYRGRGMSFGGGIGQGILINGDLDDPAVMVRGLNSVGGWAQAKFKATPRLEFNAALGVDNPFARDIRLYGGPYGYYGPWLSKNLSPFGNFIYHARSNVLFSVEYRRLQTFALDSNSTTLNHVNASVGYLF